MRQIILVILAMTIICMPLFAQENGAAGGSGAETSAGCGKVMMGSFGEAPADSEADGSANAVSGAEMEGTGIYADPTLIPENVPPGAAEGSEVVDGSCSAPNADGTLTCNQGGMAYDCYCCDANDQPAPCNDIDPPCCVQ
jgi:hypothetical protein